MIKIIWLTTSPKIRYKRQKYKFNRKIMGNRELIQVFSIHFFPQKTRTERLKEKPPTTHPPFWFCFITWTSKNLRYTTKLRTACLGDKGNTIFNIPKDFKNQFSDTVQSVKDIIKNIFLWAEKDFSSKRLTKCQRIIK